MAPWAEVLAVHAGGIVFEFPETMQKSGKDAHATNPVLVGGDRETTGTYWPGILANVASFRFPERPYFKGISRE